jgi:hypothetical protein
MSDDLVRVTVSDGKYTFIQKEDGSCIALRYGEPWREDIFDGLMLGMAHRIKELEAKLAKVRTDVLQHVGEALAGMSHEHASPYSRQLIKEAIGRAFLLKGEKDE